MATKDKENKKEKYNPDVTEEDLAALGKKDLSMDAKDDRILQERKQKVDFTGKDLDIPDGDKNIFDHNRDLKDEENEHYSQGGEGKEHLEERKDSDSISKNKRNG